MDKIGEYTLEITEKADWYNSWLFGLIKPYFYGKILEVGAGIGVFTGLLLKEGELTAVDINKKYIARLKKKYGKMVSVGFGNIQSGDYFFKNQKFDTIVCLNVLEHIKNDKKAIGNIYKLLHKGGKLILLVPAHQKLFSEFDKDLGHFRRYSKNEVAKKLMAADFDVERIKYLNWWAAIGWFVFLKSLKRGRLPAKEVSIFNKLGRFFLWPEKYIDLPFGLSVLAIAKKI